jgi:maleylpyruvate isomerase
VNTASPGWVKMSLMTHVEGLDGLTEATQRLVRAVDSLSDQAMAEPSVLPGWSRAHVVAHLTLNAEALAGVLTGVKEGEDVAMYASQEARDADIDELAAVGSTELRERFLAATAGFEDAVVAVPEGGWVGDFRRLTSGGQRLARIGIPGMRHREVEIHHADLGVGYGPGHWPHEFLAEMFDRAVDDRSDEPGVVLRTPEGETRMGVGDGPAVSGSRADVTWWLLGRGNGEGLVADPHLPELGAWR